MSKSTPGPWKVCYDGSIDSVNGKNICVLRFDSYKEYNDNPELKANAHLIASAPELLEMCKKASDAIKSLPIDSLGEGTYIESNGEQAKYPLRDELIDNINKAITKAEGVNQ